MIEKVEQRMCIKFCQNHGQSFVETYKTVKKVYGDNSMSRTQVYAWFRRFKDGRTSVQSDQRPGRPSTSRNAEMIGKVREAIRDNRRLTVRELSADLGISLGSVQTILTEDLGMGGVSAKFVPRLLTDEQRETRLPIANDLQNYTGVHPNCDDSVTSDTMADVEHAQELDEDSNSQAWDVKAVKLEPKVEIFVEEHEVGQRPEGSFLGPDNNQSTSSRNEVASQAPEQCSDDSNVTVPGCAVRVSSNRGRKRKMSVEQSSDGKSLESNTNEKMPPKTERSAVNSLRRSTSEKQFDCETCGKSFTLRSQITKHLREHSDDRPYTCKFCHEHFSGSGPLERHERLNTGDIPYRCKLCSKEFMYGCSLLLHLRSHTVDKPYICKLCNKSLVDSRSLLKHLRLHAGVTGYRCEVCGKHFTRKSELTRHFRVHTGEKPYHCKTCSKCFSQSNDLARHVLTHTGERPYQCEQCAKCFQYGSTLTRHIRMHSGVKPFSCDACHKSFTRREKLLKHQATHRT